MIERVRQLVIRDCFENTLECQAAVRHSAVWPGGIITPVRLEGIEDAILGSCAPPTAHTRSENIVRSSLLVNPTQPRRCSARHGAACNPAVLGHEYCQGRSIRGAA